MIFLFFSFKFVPKQCLKDPNHTYVVDGFCFLSEKETKYYKYSSTSFSHKQTV